jgi:methylthioribose-1-phosphate isomerase
MNSHGIPHHLIVDNAGGHLMQHGQVDMVITGTDRTTASGDVCNKIGTYLKALAAHDNDVPFYVALPSPHHRLDGRRTAWREIPIEERDGREVTMSRAVLKTASSPRCRSRPGAHPAAIRPLTSRRRGW